MALLLTIDIRTNLNATQSPLLRLPAEIRNAIYTLVFSDQVYKFAVWPYDEDGYRSMIGRAEQPWCLGLLLTSRQVHHETALFPYKLATFDFGMNDDFPRHALEFLEDRSEAQIEALGRLMISFPDEICIGTGAYFFERLGCHELL